MTDTMIDLPGVIAKSDDAGVVRELIQDAAQRLIDIEVAAVCGAAHGQRSPDRENQRSVQSAMMLEQNDEWAVARRYMPVEKLTTLCNDPDAATMIAAQ